MDLGTKNQMVRFKKISCFSLKYQVQSPQREEKMFRVS